jgi:Eco57I restriction-modification methylase
VNNIVDDGSALALPGTQQFYAGVSTYWVGDVYQHVSDEARKGRALVQTPHFVAKFLLERTLLPALREFGVENTRMIDPACGTGHILLPALHMIVGAWVVQKDMDASKAVQRAVGQVAGVDIDPVAATLARIRLAAEACLIAGKPLTKAGDWQLDIAAADSLLHGPDSDGNGPPADHACDDPGCADAIRILGDRYEAVVANPPYIRPKEPKNSMYRARYRTCYKKYALSVPFTELLFGLAVGEKHVAMAPPEQLSLLAVGEVAS